MRSPRSCFKPVFPCEPGKDSGRDLKIESSQHILLLLKVLLCVCVCVLWAAHSELFPRPLSSSLLPDGENTGVGPPEKSQHWKVRVSRATEDPRVREHQSQPPLGPPADSGLALTFKTPAWSSWEPLSPFHHPCVPQHLRVRGQLPREEPARPGVQGEGCSPVLE